MNNQQGVGSATGQLRCSGNGLRDLVPAYVNSPGERLQSGGGAVGVVARHAIHGLGGVGKTRLAVESAWQHQADCTAVLFVEAASPTDLHRNLAELCKPAVLDLPEAAATEELLKVDARWPSTSSPSEPNTLSPAGERGLEEAVLPAILSATWCRSMRSTGQSHGGDVKRRGQGPEPFQVVTALTAWKGHPTTYVKNPGSRRYGEPTYDAFFPPKGGTTNAAFVPPEGGLRTMGVRHFWGRLKAVQRTA